MDNLMPCVGLFGTCGNSRWRDPFIQRFASQNIAYFNPQVEAGTWHAGLVEAENSHFVEDDIILFPVTDETTGQGSLAEIGFSIANALRCNANRFFVFLIEDECNDPDASDEARAESVRSRRLVKSKLMQIAATLDNVFLVESLGDMMTVSLKLAELLRVKAKIGQDFRESMHVITGFSRPSREAACHH